VALNPRLGAGKGKKTAIGGEKKTRKNKIPKRGGREWKPQQKKSSSNAMPQGVSPTVNWNRKNHAGGEGGYNPRKQGKKKGARAKKIPLSGRALFLTENETRDKRKLKKISPPTSEREQKPNHKPPCKRKI